MTTIKSKRIITSAIEAHDKDTMTRDNQPTGNQVLACKLAQEDEEKCGGARVLKVQRVLSPARAFEGRLLQSSEANAAALKAFTDSEVEADPKGDHWDNLDARDADDPLMVSKYVSEIFDYMRSAEVSLSIFLYSFAIS